MFTASHQRYWDAARSARGDAKGTRALIAILLAHDTMATGTLINRTTMPCVEPRDISHAVLFLASEEARYITGNPQPVDAGALLH